MSTIKVCKEIDLNTMYDLSSLRVALGYTTDEDEDTGWVDERVWPNINNDTDIGFCYLKVLEGISSNVKPEHVPAFLEVACQEVGDDSILMWSVTSCEKYYQEWLDAVSMYPGATITSMVRGAGPDHRRTVYCCLVPTTPQFPDEE